MTLIEVLYLLVLIIELVFLISASLYLISLIYSWLKGAPYVATQKKTIKSILKNAKIRDGQHIIELGCGDGRFLLAVARQYKITGLGVDINPLPIIKARILARLQKVISVSFQVQDIRKTDLIEADVVYIFLFPKLIQSLKNQLLEKTKRGVLIISHGFKIDYLDTYLVKIFKGEKFKTYFYKLT